jgi:hypothetical protein
LSPGLIFLFIFVNLYQLINENALICDLSVRYTLNDHWMLGLLQRTICLRFVFIFVINISLFLKVLIYSTKIGVFF